MKTVLALRNPFGYHRHRPLNSAAGQTLPLVVLFMGVLIAMSGLVIDLGNSYVQKRSTQNVADAAALAGAATNPPGARPAAAPTKTTPKDKTGEPGAESPTRG